MAADAGGATDLTASDIDAVRALLRRSDEGARREGLAMIDGWEDRLPDPAGAGALLKAATLAYPWVRSQRIDPALRLARLLCRSPRAVEVRDVEAAYLVSAERVRRVLLHLLALRRDADGVTALSFLIGPDGPTDLLPLPTGGLLTPALQEPSAVEMVPALVHVAARPGWAWHAAELLEQLVSEGRLDRPQHVAIADGLTPVVAGLVEACDRATAERERPGRDRPQDGAEDERSGRDRTRADRFRLRSLVSLFRAVPGEISAPALRRVLASADARVGAMGATALLSSGQAVAPERLDLVARDPEARAELLDGLAEIDRLQELSPSWRTGRSRAEAELVRWLSADTELGTRPDELEHLQTLAAGEHPDDGAVHLFRFRLRSPHWSSARGWMVGAAGPFRADGSVADGFEAFASSVYSAEDEDHLDGHLDTILDALGAWSDPEES